MNIVQVVYKNSNIRYVFEVPEGVKLLKGDLVETHNVCMNIAQCVTDSEEVSENVVDMIMEGKKVTAKITGKYTLESYREANNE